MPAPGTGGPAGGVAVPAGGVAVPGGGVVAPGVELCPVDPEPPAGAVPPDGELCATTQLAQHTITNNNAIFVFDIFLIPLKSFDTSWIKSHTLVGPTRNPPFPSNQYGRQAERWNPADALVSEEEALERGRQVEIDLMGV